ncbi:hypothetical protein [Bacillus solitudinis]|uniref:hypothetical protein n=1 Tax=Bacillus solitudinis TaxID=2014074 RepID=UPI000C231385|nr:hypothetical protein [Bacillus solitudinis]
MTEVWNLAGAIILSFGGSGVILLGLSSWLGRIWATRILEKEKKEHTLEIENFKSQLQNKINVANSLIDKSVHVTKLQYDKEFSIYLEIWEQLSSCVVSTKKLYPSGVQNIPYDEKELEEFNKKKWAEFATNYNDFSNIITKYAPFYEEKLYEKFIELRNLCSRQGKIFEMYEFDVKYSATFTFSRDAKLTPEEHKEVYTEFHEKVAELQKSLTKQIREHLKSLQAIEH